MDPTIHLGELWSSAALVIGFQLLAFSWRLSRELELMRFNREKNPNEDSWFPLGDYLNLLSMVVLVFRVFIWHPNEHGLGLSLILLAGYPFAILGHYRLLKKGKPTDRPYCTIQEAAGITVTLIAAAGFTICYHVFYHRFIGWCMVILAFIATVIMWRYAKS